MAGSREASVDCERLRAGAEVKVSAREDTRGM
jgi:hypothetical protein